ncbi:ankyrin repeat and fibronectin type-III domain-containing protein 1-like isoform X1 [Arapaima gigas]
MSVRKPPLRRRSLGTVSPKRLYRNLSVRLRGGESFNGGDSKPSRYSSTASPYYKSLWEAVENEDILAVKNLLLKNTKYDGGAGVGQRKKRESEKVQEDDVNTVNEEGLVPLDVAILTQNSPLLHVLIKAGGKHNPHLNHPSEWAEKLDALVDRAGDQVCTWREALLEMAGAGPGVGLQRQAEAQRQLRIWTLRRQLYYRMRDIFHHTVLPGPPSSVSLAVTSISSLTVSFKEPSFNTTGLITCYKVEWSTSSSFRDICGSDLVLDTKNLTYTITGLESGVHYFVRVSAYNVKGWGPPQDSRPVGASPSSWRECSSVRLRNKSQVVGVMRLLEQIREPQYKGYCTESSKQQESHKRVCFSRGLKHLFHSTTKFVSLLQRGVYLATIFYHKENILLTSNDQIPLIEIQNCSTSITQGFQWFAKLSYAWQRVPWLLQALSSSQSSSSSLLQSRHNILQAVAYLQSSLGTLDLGQLYYEPLKDRQGNVLLVTMKECSTPIQPVDPLLYWAPLGCLERNKSRTALLVEPTVVEALTENLEEKLSYHRRSMQRAHAGFYVGILKLCSSVDQIRILVPQKLPNLLCHTRVRHNPHISREEWEWLQNIGVIRTSADQETDATQSTGSRDFVTALRSAITHLLTKLSIPLHRACEYHVYTRELLQIGEDVSLLLLFPPSENFTACPRSEEGKRDPGLTLPLQVFELVHFWAYERDFLSQYCQAWVLLELDVLLSQQALREALDKKEIQDAKERLAYVSQLSQGLDAMWREMRWIPDVLQCVRSKHSTGAALLSVVMGDMGHVKLPKPAVNLQPINEQQANVQDGAVSLRPCTLPTHTPVQMATSESGAFNRTQNAAGAADGARYTLDGQCSSDDQELAKARDIGLEGSSMDPKIYTRPSSQNTKQPEKYSEPLRDECTEGNFPSIFSQLRLQNRGNSDLASGISDAFNGFNLEANGSDVFYSFEESRLWDHNSELESGHHKQKTRHLKQQNLSTSQISGCQTSGDWLNKGPVNDFENDRFWENFGGAIVQSSRSHALPARSLVEWVSSSSEQS